MDPSSTKLIKTTFLIPSENEPSSTKLIKTTFLIRSENDPSTTNKTNYETFIQEYLLEPVISDYYLYYTVYSLTENNKVRSRL